MRNRGLWLLAGVLLGAVFLTLALRDTPWQALRGALAEARGPWLFATLFSGVLFMLLKAWRWRLLLRRTGALPSRVLHRAVWAGAALNLVIAHTGELLRASIASRRSGLAMGALLASIALERVFDFAALAILSGVAMLLDAGVRDALGPVGLTGLAVVVVAVPGALLLLRSSPVQPRLQGWLARQLAQARTGLQSLLEPSGLATALLLSVLQWGCIVMAIDCAARAVGASVPPAAAVATFGLMVLGLTLPSAPAQLGTTQLAFVAGFALAGVTSTVALAASFVYTGCVVIPALVMGGLWALQREPAAAATAASPAQAAAAPAPAPAPVQRNGR